MDELSVKAASLITGISAHTLRAWENRYTAVEPRRTVSGRRVYTREDVSRLKLLKVLVDQGHSIGRIAHLPTVELEGMAVFESTSETQAASRNADNPFVQRIVDRLGVFDLPEVYNLIQLAQHHFSLRGFVLDVISPVFREIGILVMAGRMDMSQEHAFSAIMRHHLGGILHSVQSRFRLGSRRGTDAPVIAFATPEGELHEFGILLASILTGLQGCQVVYLGPNLPPSSLALAARSLGARLVVLGISPGPAGKPELLARYIQKLDDVLDAGIDLWIGGEGVNSIEIPQESRRSMHRLSDLPALDAAIGRWITVQREEPVRA